MDPICSILMSSDEQMAFRRARGSALHLTLIYNTLPTARAPQKSIKAALVLTECASVSKLNRRVATVSPQLSEINFI
jgi:hypothetical protein